MPPLSSKTRIGLTVAELVAFALFFITWGGSLVSVKSDIAVATETAEDIRKIHKQDIEDIKSQQTETYNDLKTDMRTIQADIKQILREMKR